MNEQLHPSEIEAGKITAAQVDIFYNLACEMFPTKAPGFQQLMNALDEDKASPTVQFHDLLCSIHDWFHYGN